MSRVWKRAASVRVGSIRSAASPCARRTLLIVSRRAVCPVLPAAGAISGATTRSRTAAKAPKPTSFRNKSRTFATQSDSVSPSLGGSGGRFLRTLRGLRSGNRLLPTSPDSESDNERLGEVQSDLKSPVARLVQTEARRDVAQPG